MVADLRRALAGCTGMEFQGSPRAEYNRRDPPWLQPRIDLDDGVATAEKNDIDCEAHEEHVHPHEWREAAVVEEHAGAGLEPVAAQQTAALAGKAARILESRA